MMKGNGRVKEEMKVVHGQPLKFHRLEEGDRKDTFLKLLRYNIGEDMNQGERISFSLSFCCPFPSYNLLLDTVSHNTWQRDGKL